MNHPLAPLILLLTSVAAGCAASPRTVVEPWSAPPLPYVIYVALPEALDAEEGSGIVAIDSDRLRGALQEAIGGIGACTRLRVIQASGETAWKVASEGDADLLVEVVPRGLPEYRFRRRNHWFIPNTLLWFMVGFPSFWLPDRVYSIDWGVAFRASHVPSEGSENTFETGLYALERERALHLASRGWKAPALYTPPGFYEGPDTPRALAPDVEQWLVEQARAYLEFEVPRLPFSVDISIQSPENLATFSPAADAGPRLEAEITTPTPLQRLRVLVDNKTLLSLSPYDMIESARDRGRHRYRLERDLHVDPGPHEIRILALESRHSDQGAPIVDVGASHCSASKTVRFSVIAD